MVILIKKYIHILLIVFLIIVIRLFDLKVYKSSYYKKELEISTKKYVYGLSAPRGRILDINGKVIVDNIKERVLVYRKDLDITSRKHSLQDKSPIEFRRQENRAFCSTTTKWKSWHRAEIAQLEL